MAKVKQTKQDWFVQKVGDVLIAVEELDKAAEAYPAGRKVLEAALEHIAKRRNRESTRSL